ncbi:Hypothetical_protein [Hexamita inflata]|uniref:Hypothetical_protein n=1 Tax=Hexamita inflata TaxID=28002 RepID=A0ABP1JEH5_9EUKA
MLIMMVLANSTISALKNEIIDRLTLGRIAVNQTLRRVLPQPNIRNEARIVLLNNVRSQSIVPTTSQSYRKVQTQLHSQIVRADHQTKSSKQGRAVRCEH